MGERWRGAVTVRWLLLACALGCSGCTTARSPATSIIIPAAGLRHVVRQGETLAAIGRMYGITWQTLARVNQLADPHLIEVGQAIWIPPNGRDAYSPLPRLAIPPQHAPNRPLQWPVQGVLSSGFGRRGGRLHAGIDISGERGTPILAADDGTVLFSGHGPNGYGNTVMLAHHHGLVSLYAHNERNVVRSGARIQRGQTIAFMGDSGRASGTHLHFEVHYGGRLTDPLQWLP